VPVGVGGYVQAYARMMVAYAALFVPLVAAGQSRASTDEPLAPVSDTREAVAAVAVLLAKLALELTLVVGTERRDGQVFLLGRPLVFRLRRI
jgi:hypothetical protein